MVHLKNQQNFMATTVCDSTAITHLVHMIVIVHEALQQFHVIEKNRSNRHLSLHKLGNKLHLLPINIAGYTHFSWSDGRQDTGA